MAATDCWCDPIRSMFGRTLIPPKGSVLAGIGAEAFIAAGAGAVQEPAAAVGRGAADGVNEAVDFSGEALPECGAESWRTILESLRAGNTRE